MNDCPGEFYDDYENDYNDLNQTVVIYRKNEDYLLLRREFDTMMEALNYSQDIAGEFKVIGVVRKNYPVTV